MNSDRSLVEQWNAFQIEMTNYNNELTEQMKRASEFIFVGKANDSIGILSNALKKSDTFYEYWNKWMDKYAIKDSKDWLKQQRAQTRASILVSIGHANKALNKYDDAQKDYEEALSLVSDNLDPFRGSLLQALGMINELQGQFEKAKRNYLNASDLFKVLSEKSTQYDPENQPIMRSLFLEEVAKSLSYAAFNALAQDKRDEFQQYMNDSIDFAHKNGLNTLEVKLKMRINSYLLTSDPSGEVFDNIVKDYGKDLEKLEDFAKSTYSKSKDIDLVIDVILFKAEYKTELGVRSEPISMRLLKDAEHLILFARELARGTCPKAEDTTVTNEWARFLSEQGVTKRNAEKEWKALMGLTWLYGSIAEHYQSIEKADKAQEETKKAIYYTQEALSIAKMIKSSSLQVGALQMLIPMLSNPKELKKAKKKIGRLMR